MHTANEIRRQFIDFFVKSHKHVEIPSASLIPENDPTVLFTTAGMHPLVPYLMGEPHPNGFRLVDAQKCLRTDDIDEVGDLTHLTFFEMLGNWSLGDYFKAGATEMSIQLLTHPWEKGGYGLPIERLLVTCFAGDEDAPRDMESAEIWKKHGIPQERIYFYPKSKNWWGPAGQIGPCGPDTEMFYDTVGHADLTLHKTTPPEDRYPPIDYPGFRQGNCHPNCECGRYVELWNDVFMQYNKVGPGKFEALKQKNVDTGLGFERLVAILHGKPSHYETQLFSLVMLKIYELAKPAGISVADWSKRAEAEDFRKSTRIIADHIRAATFILGDRFGVTPSNVDRGYILRRLIRRAIRHGKKIGINTNFSSTLAESFITLYKDVYPELSKNRERILDELRREEIKFYKTLHQGERLFERQMALVNRKMILEAVEKIYDQLSTKEQKILGYRFGLKEEDMAHTLDEVGQRFHISRADVRAVEAKIFPHMGEYVLDAETAFRLYDTYGFPIEMTKELAAEYNSTVDIESFRKKFHEHQEISRAGAEQKFSGGLADHSEQSKMHHTATHLVHQALRDVLGPHVFQKGSNITKERLRFDFSHSAKMTPEQIKKTEEIVNRQIQQDLPVHFEMLEVDEAKKRGAIGLFDDKYAQLGNKVKVYFMGDYSREVCGGPHVEHTGVLKNFKILKEEACSAGVRRIKAVVEGIKDLQ